MYRREIYKEDNDKPLRPLNVLILSDLVKQKVRVWMRKPTSIDLLCELVTEEMNNVHDVELLSGVANVTAEFIRTWTLSARQDIALFVLEILFTAVQTSTAREKTNKKSRYGTLSSSQRTSF